MPGGRPNIFKTPEDLENAALAYFTWCNDTPWIKTDVIRSGDRAGELLSIPTQRPYTIIAMCHHIGIDVKTFYNYEKNPEFFHITTHIVNKIRNQKYEGAAVGAFNANIIARDLGLTDNQNVTIHTEQPLFKPLKIKDENPS